MGGVRVITALIAAALCALALAACGGDGDDSTSTTAGGDTTTQAATGDGTTGGDATSGEDGGSGNATGGGQGSAGDGGDGDGGDGGGSGDGGDDSGSGGSGSIGGPASFGPSKNPTPKLKGERSASFSHAGGDNSIQEYGEELGSEDRRQATVALAALFSAIETGDWTSVCANYLSKANIEQLEMVAEKAKQVQGKDCAGVLSSFTQKVPNGSPDRLQDSVASMRSEGDTAFAIWLGVDGKGYAMPFKNEGGAWKFTALAPTPLEF